MTDDKDTNTSFLHDIGPRPAAPPLVLPNDQQLAHIQTVCKALGANTDVETLRQALKNSPQEVAPDANAILLLSSAASAHQDRIDTYFGYKNLKPSYDDAAIAKLSETLPPGDKATLMAASKEFNSYSAQTSDYCEKLVAKAKKASLGM